MLPYTDNFRVADHVGGPRLLAASGLHVVWPLRGPDLLDVLDGLQDVILEDNFSWMTTSCVDSSEQSSAEILSKISLRSM